MQVKVYLTSARFRTYIPDWITTAVLLVVFFGFLETARPFTRQFSISDQRLSHPFAVHERVTDLQLYIYSAVIPSIIIVVLSVANAASELDKLHLVNVSGIAFWLTISVTSVLTDVLKILIGNPRPDFLQRCGANAATVPNFLVDIDVCTAPMGVGVVLEGLKSTPSGHSSLAFAGLGFLTFWLVGQYKLLAKRDTKSSSTSRPVALWLLFGSPLVFATYIALSRTQDYRHHFFDVGFGSVIGIVFAYFGYFKYFNSVFDVNSNKPIDYDL